MTTKNVPFLDLERAFTDLGEAAEKALIEVARSGNYILGPNVAALEEEMASYLGTQHAIAVGSGTDALHLAVAAAGLGPGDEVITTPFTFAATVEAIEYVGAQPVLVDIDPDTYNIDPEKIREALTEKTRGVIPVHLFGLPADMREIMAIASEHDIAVIEDAAQSLGAKLDDQQTGSVGTAGAFSFYPSKTLGCFGDGGMIATNDSAFFQRLRELRNHGFDANGEHVRLGYNSRLDEIHAAILRIKLMQLDDANRRRRDIASHYNDIFTANGAKVQHVPDGYYHAYGYYTLCVENRDQVRARLREDGVATALYYGKPLSHHTHYAESCRYGSLAHAEDISERCLALPIFPEMDDSEVEYVASRTVAAFTSGG